MSVLSGESGVAIKYDLAGLNQGRLEMAFASSPGGNSRIAWQLEHRLDHQLHPPRDDLDEVLSWPFLSQPGNQRCADPVAFWRT
jgi:hypothetical protein